MTTPKFWSALRITLPAVSADRAQHARMRDSLAEIGHVLEADGEMVWMVESEGAPGTSTIDELSVSPDSQQVEQVEARIRELATVFGIAIQIEREVHEEDDWREAWKAFYRPLVFGSDRQRVLIRPSWIERRPSDPELEVVLDPGRAFGTGQHETTQLCVDLLCTWALQEPAPRAILDLGCGSGILALVAARLFPAAQVVALDNDAEAVDVTRENATVNAVAHRLRILQSAVETFDEVGFDVVIANLRPDVLVPHAAHILNRLGSRGRAVLSGILDEEGDRVAQAWNAAGATIVERRHAGGWCALHVRGQP